MDGRVLGTSVGISALAAAIEFAGAAVVVYDNSDQTFFWKLSIRDIDGTPYPGTFLDITKSASEQTGEQRPGTIGKWYRPNQTSSSPATRSIIGEDGVRTAKTTDWVWIPWKDKTFHVQPTRDYMPGELVESSDNWALESTYFWHLPFSMGFEGGSSGIGDPAYLGVRVRMADNQWHYGWIYFTEYQWPLAWAYETEPNMPIQIPVPAPSAGIYLMIAGLSLRSRQR
ncbi:MAG: hypothetical protein IT435_08430 [Phycisphaerales bacterium]|nr:hypothetical protein [Phycisphaerales bacterium]